MIEKLKEQINEESKVFLDRYLKDAVFIDTLKRDSVETYVYLLYRWKESDRIGVCCLALKDSGCKPCFWGSLTDYVWQLACDAVEGGYKNRHSHKVYAERVIIEKKFIERYNLSKKYFWGID